MDLSEMLPTLAPTANLMVSLGDSFTEGMCDDTYADGAYRGWADRVAAQLAAHDPEFRYANLAVRGKLIGQIADEQIPVAAAMRPTLATLAGGVNDVLRPRCDVARVEARVTECVAGLAASADQVVLFHATDPSRRLRASARIVAAVKRINAHVDALAAEHGCIVVDLFGTRVFDDVRMWDEDRLHLSPEGHRRVAEAVMQALGAEPQFDWQELLAPARPTPWLAARRGDLRWARMHLLPWIGRRLRGKSSGDGRPAKRPEPTQVETA